jgi:hypothetical protein
VQVKIGQLLWNIDPVLLYPDLDAAVFDSRSVPVDSLDGPHRCNQLSLFLKKPVTYCNQATFFLVVDTSYNLGDMYDAIEVVAGDKKGWIVKRDFQFLHPVT